MQNKLKVSLAYNSYPDAVLDELTTAIIAAMTGNAAFPTPTIPLAMVTTRQTAFRDALAAAANGGTQLTAAKNQARQALTDALDANALYVQTQARYDLAMLLSSGYQAASTNRAQSQLATPSIMDIENELSTQLVVRLSPIPNAYAYEAQVKNGAGGFVPAGTFTQSRRIILTGLTPGQIYTVQVRAVGGRTGYSDWSDPMSHMAM